MKTHGVYCKRGLSNRPVLLMEGNEEKCQTKIRELALEYSEQSNFKTELTETPAFQLLVTDLGGKSLFETKYFFVAPIGDIP